MTTTNPTEPIAFKRFDAIDGFRAYASIGIVIMHILANSTPRPDANLLTTTIIPWFTDFTLLFMVISGFSVSYGYFDKIREGHITPLQFYRKRYIRLLPFYALMCALDVTMSPSWRALAEAFTDITLTNGLVPEMELNVIGVGWFMGVVMLYYVFFPFIVFLQSNRIIAIASLIGTLLIVWISLTYSDTLHPIDRRFILYCLPLFLTGGMLYIYRHRILSISRLGHYTLLFFAVTATLLPFITSYNTGFDRLIICLIVFTIWTIYAISAQPFYRPGQYSFLQNPVTRYIASISLEIYLCHMVIFRGLELFHIDRFVTDPNLLYITNCVIVITGSIIFAHITKFHIIDPIIKKYIK